MVEAITRQGMSLEDFLSTEEDDHLFEIIDGERVPLDLYLSGESEITQTLFIALDKFLVEGWEVFQKTFFVHVSSDNPDWVEAAFKPNVIVMRQADVDALQRMSNWRERPFSVIPAFVMEVITQRDRFSTMLRKVAAYLDLGIQVIWLVNPRTDLVTIYSAGRDDPEVLGADEMLTIDDLFPGFRIDSKQLFQ